MQAQAFLERISSYLGISSMVKEYGYQDILEQAAGIFSVKNRELEQYYFDGYQRAGEDVLYRYVLRSLCKNILFYDQVFDALLDEPSRFVFTRLVQYQVLPERSFLQRMVEEESNPCFPVSEDAVKSGEILVLESGISGMLEWKDRIKKEKPKLVISADKSFTDIWEIPKLLEYICPGYQVYLRCHERQGGLGTYCYGIWSGGKGSGMDDVREAGKDGASGGKGGTDGVGEARKGMGADSQKEAEERQVRDVKEPPARRKRVVAMTPYERGWSNVELVKDCGLIPYLLHKNHGCDVTMVGARGDSYPYLEEYIKGVNMEFLPDGSQQAKLDYITRNAREIDCLILRGCYPTNTDVARFYKYYNPSGRIYIGLDANSSWMDRIPWSDKSFWELLNCCDVIATSCRVMQKHLNLKWPWKIELLPNGYYCFSLGGRKVPEFSAKEEVILTVSRLGSAQKATNLLLEAFAAIAEEVPGWKLRLVGSVETDFEEYLEDYRKMHPKLMERICFVGPVKDRAQLFGEHLKAKIFALPSIYEGGTPNVVAEALNAGCAMAVSRFDAYEDATDNGKCGVDAKIGDMNGFAKALLRLCKDRQLNEMSKRAYWHGTLHFDMERIVARLNQMIFEGK